MIGTHDSFTYLKAKNKIYELFSFLWRTQTKTIKEQQDLGVKYLDIRVYRTKDGYWELCHGLVNFNKRFKMLYDILDDYQDFHIRLILEKGNSKDEECFEKELLFLPPYLAKISFAAIKKNWRIILNEKFQIMDYTYIPFYSNLSFWQNIKRMNWFNTIKKWAKKHNPIITQKMKEDKNIVHFIDRL